MRFFLGTHRPNWLARTDVDLFVSNRTLRGRKSYPRARGQWALDFVRTLLEAPIPRIALENPVSIISSRIRKPDQIIQPWQFGHGETKTTCWWLKNLPKLCSTNVVEGRENRVWKQSPSPDRWKERSRTLVGVADAIAEQWGAWVAMERVA